MQHMECPFPHFVWQYESHYIFSQLLTLLYKDNYLSSSYFTTIFDTQVNAFLTKLFGESNAIVVTVYK